MYLRLVLSLILLLFATDSFACADVGIHPEAKDHLTNFERSVTVFDVIFRGRIVSVRGDVATIEVDEIFKGELHLSKVVQYQTQTDCDELYTNEGGDSLFFGGVYRDLLNFPAGIGTVPSESEVFDELLERLRIRFTETDDIL